MSARAQRFFGCILPLLLAFFGCIAVLMVGYAGQVFVQLLTVPDAAMAPALEPGWSVIVDNTAFWTVEPQRGETVSVRRPEGLVFRRLVALPGETVEIRAGAVLVDGLPCDGETRIKGVRCHAGAGELADMAPLRLAADTYFVMAADLALDDSRAWGAVPREDIVGKPVFHRKAGGGFDPIVTPPPPTDPPVGQPSATDETS